MEKILVLRGGALGDFIVTLPALAMLRERWPSARIELVGNATAATLALSRGLLDAAHSQHEGRWAQLYGDAVITSEFSAWLRDFDLIVSFWPDPDGELRRRFPLHDRQRFLSGNAMPATTPAAAHYCEVLRALDLEPRTFHFALGPLAAKLSSGENVTTLAARTNRSSVSDPVVNVDRKFPGRTQRIFIHPGSGSPRKNWAAQNRRTLIRQLPAPVTLVLGEAERAVWGEFPAADGRSIGSTQRDETNALPGTLVNAPLEDLVGAFTECRLFVGHDSGISHLAAACGAKCVLLFGPTEPACWAPPAPNVRVLRRGSDLASLSVGDVRSAVEAAFADRR